MKQKPTTEQIAALCAVLATKGKDSLETLAARAVGIWEAAENAVEARYQHAEKNLTKDILRSLDEMRARFSKPKSYPVTYDDLGRLLFPEMDTADRAITFKQVLGYRESNQAAVTKDEIDRQFAALRQTTYDKENEYLNAADRIKSIYKKVKPQIISARRSESGKKGAARRKSIDTKP